ncbi:hypothetical protein GF324_13690 [bacterium]|nr:hypothetical protein [bacterium]
MTRYDALFYSIAFYAYLGSFISYIVHVAFKKEKAGLLGTILAAVGLVPHTIAFFLRWAAKGTVPLANMYEYMGLMSWMVVVGLLYYTLRFKNHRLGVLVSPVAVMLLVVASLLPSDINRQLMPALQSAWLAIHVSLAALGSGAFLIAYAAGSVYLLSENGPNPKLEKQWIARHWKNFAIFWIGVPILTAIVLMITGLLPTPINQASRAMMDSGSAITAFAIGSGPNALYLGPLSIGLGIGMVIGAILWPFFNARQRAENVDSTMGGRFFTVLVLGLLLGAVLVGFAIKGDFIRVTDRSYFKIFEFFGPTLVLSWVLTPVIHAGLVKPGGSWITRIGVPRGLAEDISYSAVAVGYPLYTVGALFAGAIWAEQAWGTWWSWDPKEVGALIIWLFYTGFLHARYQRQWKGNRAAVLVVFGMVMVFISFFGNYFFGGLHSFEVT